MKTQKTKATKRQSVRQTGRSTASAHKPAAKSVPTKRSMRRTYPVHKRLLLNPLSMFIILCAGVYMTGMTYHVVADTTISTTVYAAPLKAPALIQAPESGEVITNSPISVTGSCPDDSYIKLGINGYYSGVAWCTDQTFTITTSLFAGSNELAVQDFNQTNQAGPAETGNSRTITYSPPVGVITRIAPPASQTTTSQTTSGAPDNSDSAALAPAQMILQSEFQFHTFTTEKPFSWPVTLTGGTPPYAVDVKWGDGSSAKLPSHTGTDLSLEHQFKTDGYYAVVVTSTDTHKQQQTMQLAALITKDDGSASFLGGSTHGSTPSQGLSVQGLHSMTLVKWLVVAWPSYVIVLLMTASFWLGEKREFAMVTMQHTQRSRPRTSRR